MSNYTAPVEDMGFVLREVVELEKLCSETGADASTIDILDTVLEAAGKLAKEEIEPINKPGDLEGLKINNAGEVTTATGFKEAYHHYVEGGWGSLQFDPKYGGQGVPFVVAASVQEMWHSANMSWGLCPLLTQGAVEAITHNASDELKQRYLPKLISGKWSGTMNLTEGDAGTDVGALKTRATPEDDHYLIRGQKIYITWGEHDMAENIVHLVLARLPNAPEGVKGISLFLVPKILVNDDGSLGERNDLKALSLEEKIGIHACPTCVMSYGDKTGAIGFLIGEENKGIQCMFTMMNNARLTVGLQGVSVSERAYQQALSFCKIRVQGVAPGHKEAGPIVRHPDVQRMLSNMKSITEASRSLTYSACAEVDFAASDLPTESLSQHKRRLGLLTPIVKGWCTENSVEITSLGLQIHGGMGFIEETGAAQHMRDARILPIYEGTNGIQALDLVGRKLSRDKGKAAIELLEDLSLIVRDSRVAKLEVLANSLEASLAACKEAITILLTEGKQDWTIPCASAFNVMMLMGGTAAGAMLAKSAIVASNLNDKSSGNAIFNKNKILTAIFYAEQVMPRNTAYLEAIRAGSKSIMALDVKYF